jgi:chromosome segregation ATPase
VDLFLRPCNSSNSTLPNKSRKKRIKTGGNEEVRVHAWVDAEGHRLFRINNKLASGNEVRTTLSRIGVQLGTSSLILQSAVTELADRNDPLALGAVIAENSGMGGWQAEALKAQAELQLNKEYEERIRQKIEKLERTSIAARDDASKSERYSEMEAAADEAAKACRLKIMAFQSAAERKRDRLVEIHAAAMDKENSLQKVASEAQKKLSDCSELTQNKRTPPTTLEVKKLKLARISIEEQLQVVLDQLNAYQSAATTLEAAKGREMDAARGCELAHREIDLLEQGLREIEMKSSSLEAAEKAQQEVAALEAKLLEARQEVEVVVAELQMAELNKLAAEMEQTKSNLIKYPDCMDIDTSVDDVDAQLADFGSVKAQLERKERALVAKQQQLPSMFSKRNNLPTLAECFNFKNPAQASKYATALELLAGRRLTVAVAQSTQQAAQLLSSGSAARGLCIWALDAISYFPDRIQVHKQIAATFPHGAVTVPMIDLLSFADEHKGVIAKAFGSHVIVSSTEIGRQVMERYGIPSIALDGTLTAKGRLAGGYREQLQRGPMHSKIQSDLEKASLIAVRDQFGELDAAEKRLKALQQQRKLEEQFMEAQAEIDAAKNSVSEASKVLQKLEMELKSRQTVAAALCQALSTLSTAADQKALLRAQLTHQTHHLKSLERAKADAAAEIADAACPPDPQDEMLELSRAQLEERLKEIDNELLLLDRNIRAEEATQSAERQDEESARQQAVAAAVEAYRAAEVKKKTLGRQINYIDTVLKEMDVLAAEMRIPATTTGTAHTGSTLDLSEIESMANDIRAVASKRSSLLAELAAFDSVGLESSSRSAVANLRAADIAEQELALLRPHAHTMHSVASRLEEGLAAVNPSAEKFNERVFDTVANVFNDLTSQLLPGIELRVARVHDGQQENSVHRKGAQFFYRRRLCGQDSSNEGNWVTGLEALSGGQRTLVSLAYLVAAKSIGGAAPADHASLSSSSILLADEVDAALDTANQEQAARLLSMLCTKKEKAPLVQVICISHSQIFQQLCDHVIELGRNKDDGTTMVMAAK